MYMNESTFVAFVPIIVHRGQTVVSESTNSIRLQKDLKKGHFYLPDLDVPLVIDLAVPFPFTYSFLHIPASNQSGMNPDHDREDSVYPTKYMLTSLVISDPPSL